MSGLPDWPNPIRSGAMQCATGATSGRTFRHTYDEVGFPCRKSATGASGLPVSRYAMVEPEHSLGVAQRHKGLSLFTPWLGKYGFENNVLEAVERGGAAFDLHAENCALPGSEQEFG